MRQLDEVVEEADRAARERREQHGQPLQREVRRRKERERRREQDHQPAHRRRARLRRVMLGQVLADVLPELVLAQERDEARADEDRHDQRHERRDEDSVSRRRHPRERVSDDLEADRARALDEHDVSRLELLADLLEEGVAVVEARQTRSRRSRASCSASPSGLPRTRGRRRARGGAARSHRGRRPRSHRAQPFRRGSRSSCGPPARSTRYSSAARIATGFAFHASLMRRPPPGSSLSSRAPPRERHLDELVGERNAERLARRERRDGVRRLVARGERERDLAAGVAHVGMAVPHVDLRRLEAPDVEPGRNERLEHGRVRRHDRDPACGERVEQLRLRAGDVLEAAEELEMRRARSR